jgi:acyl-CoA synthetase (AMP-forming)/AMP-acid ligase II
MARRPARRLSAKPGHPLDEDTGTSQVRAHLAGYKVPRIVAIVPEVLRTTTGKAELAWARRTVIAAAEGSPPAPAGGTS